jgi:magnesium chelatase family protein
MNPCRCGFAGSPDHDCICSTRDIINYKKKISGPILDRIDLKINVSNINVTDLSNKATSESSSAIKQRVIKARNTQLDRLSKHSKLTNSDIDEKIIEDICVLDSKSRQILKLAANKFKMTPRSYFRTIKVARTIADLESSEEIRKEHISEALSFRLDIN